MRAKLNLVTMSDVQKFVNAASKCEGKVILTDSERNYVVSAKSMLGAIYTLEWDEIWCEADSDIFHVIQDFMAD